MDISRLFDALDTTGGEVTVVGLLIVIAFILEPAAIFWLSRRLARREEQHRDDRERQDAYYKKEIARCHEERQHLARRAEALADETEAFKQRLMDRVLGEQK